MLYEVWEGMESAICLGLEAKFIKTKLEKEYHKVEWMSIITMQEDLNFGPRFFTKVVKSLFFDANTYWSIRALLW